MNDNELLIRIDERTKNTHDDVMEIKDHLKTQNGRIGKNKTQITIIWTVGTVGVVLAGILVKIFA